MEQITKLNKFQKREYTKAILMMDSAHSEYIKRILETSDAKQDEIVELIWGLTDS